MRLGSARRRFCSLARWCVIVLWPVGIQGKVLHLLGITLVWNDGRESNRQCKDDVHGTH